MFSLWKKIIDGDTVCRYCAALTGAKPTSMPYGRDKAPTKNGFRTGLIGNEIKMQLAYELVFDYENKSKTEGELIHLEFVEYHNKSLNTVFFKYVNIKASDELWNPDIHLTMTNEDYDYYWKGNEVRKADVEMAVDVAKWMIATDMGKGKILANDIICRKNYTPRRSPGLSMLGH